MFELLQGYKDNDGVLHKDFEVRDMNGTDEEAISKGDTKTNGGKIIRVLISRCCTRIGTLNKSDMKESKWVEIIQNLSIADQDLIMLKIREATVGEEIEGNYTCPVSDCKASIDTVIDLDELEIIPFNGVELIEFELPKGITSKDGTILKNGTMRRPKGLDREILDKVARTNIGTANTLMLTRCIVDLEGTKVTDDQVRNLSIKDRRYLMKLLEENKFGVNLDVELTCPQCGEMFKASLNASNFM